MTPRALLCLERCLPVLDGRTSAPLRVVGHVTSSLHEVFEVAETTAAGGAGGAQRFIVSVCSDLSGVLLVPLTPLRRAA